VAVALIYRILGFPPHMYQPQCIDPNPQLAVADVDNRDSGSLQPTPFDEVPLDGCPTACAACISTLTYDNKSDNYLAVPRQNEWAQPAKRVCHRAVFPVTITANPISTRPRCFSNSTGLFEKASLLFVSIRLADIAIWTDTLSFQIHRKTHSYQVAPRPLEESPEITLRRLIQVRCSLSSSSLNLPLR
jgi:hypothetical protein